MTTSPNKCSYEGCERPAYEGTGMCVLHAPAERKDPQRFRAELEQVVKPYLQCNCAGFEFPEPFGRISFLQRVSFRGAVFHGLVDFEGHKFGGLADFTGVKFKQGACFRGTMFKRGAIFHGSVLHGEIDMRYASFSTLGDFGRCSIAGRVRLLWPGEGARCDDEGRVEPRGEVHLKDLDISQGWLDFRDNHLADDTLLVVSGCNLSRILFRGTDCTMIEFYNNSWDRVAGRLVVGDEYIWRKSPDPQEGEPMWEGIATAYQLLAKQFREDCEHQVANDLDRGVLEMRRLAAPGQSTIGRLLWGKAESRRTPLRLTSRWLARFCKRFFSLNALYRYASHYGGSVLLPGLWILLGNLLVFPALYDLTLFGRNLCLLPPARCLPSLEAVIASLRVVALDRVWLSRKMLGDGVAANAISQADQFWVSVLAIVQLIFSAALVALFILSLRRRFKHGD